MTTTRDGDDCCDLAIEKPPAKDQLERPRNVMDLPIANIVRHLDWHMEYVTASQTPDPAKIMKYVFIFAEGDGQHSDPLPMKITEYEATATAKSRYWA